jgi:colanic acid biosynthesis glycosyl transferase WcaI
VGAGPQSRKAAPQVPLCGTLLHFMRLVIHTQYYPPEMGAPQARLSDLAKRLVERGHQVYVLTAMPNYPEGRIHSGYGGLLRREEQDGIPVIRTFIYPTKSTGAVRRLANYFSFVFSSLVIGAFLLPKADFILTESPPLFLGISGWILSRLKGARWILNVSDLWVESLRSFGVFRKGSLLDKLLTGMSLFLYRRAWLVTGQSEEIVSEMRRQVPGERVYHLSNGVDVSCFHPTKRDEAIRQRYLRDGEVGFVYAGLHGFFQGLDQIIVAADRLRDEPVRFLFFGEGSEKEALVRMARDRQLKNVDFHAPIAKDRVAEVLASMDVAVIPLKKEIRGSVPSKIYEAMASNMPILLVADGEARGIVEKAGAGIVVNPGDIEGLIQAVRMLASQPEDRTRMGRAGRVAAENVYSRIKIAETFEVFLMGKG